MKDGTFGNKKRSKVARATALLPGDFLSAFKNTQKSVWPLIKRHSVARWCQKKHQLGNEKRKSTIKVQKEEKKR